MNIGSNLNDRLKNINEAIVAIKSLKWVKPGSLQQSAPVESGPWGFDSDNNFINVGVKLETVGDIDPHDILKAIQSVEKEKGKGETHRDNTGAYKDRLIDIDIIAIDSLVLNTPDLTIPHPHMHERDFVILPMFELNPEWVHPLLGDKWKVKLISR